jgi:hypothetical protein
VSPSLVTRVLSLASTSKLLSSVPSLSDLKPEWNPRIVLLARTCGLTDTASHSVLLPHAAGPTTLNHSWSPSAFVERMVESMHARARSNPSVHFRALRHAVTNTFQSVHGRHAIPVPPPSATSGARPGSQSAGMGRTSFISDSSRLTRCNVAVRSPSASGVVSQSRTS